jgi:adenosylcobinamide-phosphate guanylyltransferase
MSPVGVYDQLGLHPQYIFEVNGNRMVPVGINLIDGTKVDRGELDQEILVSESDKIALNVNTPRELELARLRCEE